MKHLPILCFGILTTLPISLSANPALTIYNQNFAVVRESIPLQLESGLNEVRYDGATVHVEPDSVILRDPKGNPLEILEQNYRNDPVTQELLLSLFEGQTISFLQREPNKPDRVVEGKIIRSGYVPHGSGAMQRYGGQYAMRQMAMASPTAAGQPIIEVDGTIRFGLPGQPIFPSLGDDTILKPQLHWKIRSRQAVEMAAELGYITGGLSWEASYNVVLPEKGNTLDLTGWVTMDNQSGRDFVDAKIQLMAGDVNRVTPPQALGRSSDRNESAMGVFAQEPAVTQQSFDEYHLYTLENATTLRDRETKQVEFVRAAGVPAKTLYVYDGVKLDPNIFRGADGRTRLMNEEFGSQSQSKVAVLREFVNDEKKGLGIPLPAGRVRFYRQDAGNALQFVGENLIDHTPQGETVRLYTGDAFDLVGERRRTSFAVDNSNNWAEESFEITLRNRKKEPVEILVVEHLFRWWNWKITEKSDPYLQLTSNQIEFRVPLKPDEERKITYTVYYSW
jgi:hypothetical protein